jgi:polar amino acid transport system substrate-binding protein
MIYRRMIFRSRSVGLSFIEENQMKALAFLALAITTGSVTFGAANDIAPTGTLRAVYLSTNPAQAIRDPATGEVRGASYDLARELAKRNNVPLEFKPIPGPPAVIEAVKGGEADIGFVAYEATRLGTVEFSQTYMLVRQSFLVLDGSPIKAVADIDKVGQKIAGTRNDSITLCMKRILKQATVLELENNPADLSKALNAREIDALGANRQRLTTLSKSTAGTRLLPDDLFNVPQNIIVPKDRPAALAAINAFLDEVRTSGVLQSAIERGGAIGVAVAPAGVKAGCPG